MAMNKAEKAEMESLREQLALAKALSWPAYDKPQRMIYPKEKIGPHLERGWWFNSYNDLVDRGCFSSVSHSTHRTTETTSQGPGVFYKTREEALKALRVEVTENVAHRLARIDMEIEKEKDNPTPIED